MESINEIQQSYFKSFPPGFKFCPTDEELVHFYLLKKVNNERLPPNQIVEVDLYLYSPEYLAETYKDFEGYNGLFFFTPRVRKYPNGTRPSRSADGGYWKATGSDKPVRRKGQTIGYKRALVFYRGKPPKAIKTDWIMHEFTIKDPIQTKTTLDDTKLDNWVLCKIYERKKKQKDVEDEDENNLATFSTPYPLPSLEPQPPQLANPSFVLPPIQLDSTLQSQPLELSSMQLPQPLQLAPQLLPQPLEPCYMHFSQPLQLAPEMFPQSLDPSSIQLSQPPHLVDLPRNNINGNMYNARDFSQMVELPSNYIAGNMYNAAEFSPLIDLSLNNMEGNMYNAGEFSELVDFPPNNIVGNMYNVDEFSPVE